MESIGLRSVNPVAVLVLDRHQIELAFAEVLGAEIGIAVRDSACVRRIRIGIGKVGLQSRSQLFRRRQRPVCAAVERWLEDFLVTRIEVVVGV